MKKLCAIFFCITFWTYCYSQTEESLIDTAYSNLNKNNFYAALIDCNNALLINPNSSEAFFIKGKIKAELGDTSAAIRDLNKTFSLDSLFSEPYRYRIRLINGADKQKKLVDISKSIESAPQNALNYSARGLLKIQMSKEKEAIIDFKKSIGLYNKEIYKAPNNGILYFYRGIVKLQSSDITGFCADLKKANELGYSPATKLIEKYCRN